ncbi:MAG TPA: DEAD/DEAH box helicase, partial [Longimicrobiaceae bacterium]|nr:DEAD/DEAH box helicase [Longimicrobiaceae bacterium]
MPSFQEMGLREELLRTLEDEEITRPTELQASVVPALRRGGNLVARVSSGSGKTLAFALGILDRLEVEEQQEAAAAEGGELRLLVLTPTPADAARTALAMSPYAHAVGLSIAAIAPGWGTPHAEASVLVAPAADAMEAVRTSSVKLEALEGVVVDGAAAVEELGGWEQVDALIDLVPRDAQRVVFTARITDAVEDLIDRRVKRALRFPAEAAVAGAGVSPPARGPLTYIVASEPEKLELLAAQLRTREAGSPPPIVFCRTDERAAELAERLTVRGFIVGSANDVEAHLAIAAGGATREESLAEIDAEPGQTISYDVPADMETLRDRHAGDEDAVVLVQTREVAHIREIAGRAGFTARSAPAPADTSIAEAALRTFREEIQQALEQEDLTAQLLVLEPLLDQYSAAEVAAALAAMLRNRRPVAPATPAPAARAPAETSVAPGPAPVTWARLFVSIGSRDEARPGDLVGALAGEANISGSQIGKI